MINLGNGNGIPDSDGEDRGLLLSEKTQQADGQALKIGSSTTHGMCSD